MLWGGIFLQQKSFHIPNWSFLICVNKVELGWAGSSSLFQCEQAEATHPFLFF
jgi:hypothetical protein